MHDAKMWQGNVGDLGVDIDDVLTLPREQKSNLAPAPD
jgi:hypothetical protein